MNLSKEQREKLGKIVKKYVPEKLDPIGIELTILNITIGLRISKLRLDGYSDEEILKILEEEAP